MNSTRAPTAPLHAAMAPRPALHDPARGPLPALHDAASLRRIEARAAAQQGGEPFELMRRAGRAGWRCAPQAQRIVVVCGPGNNGGDGYVLARYALDSGRDVRLVFLPGHEPRGELARRALEDCLGRGGKPQAFDGMLPPADLVVDALFGIGLHRKRACAPVRPSTSRVRWSSRRSTSRPNCWPRRAPSPNCCRRRSCVAGCSRGSATRTRASSGACCASAATMAVAAR